MHHQRQLGPNSGGGLDDADSANLSLEDSTVGGNTAKFGGGLDDGGSGQLSLTDCTVSGNSASGHGGGLDDRQLGEPDPDRLHHQRELDRRPRRRPEQLRHRDPDRHDRRGQCGPPPATSRARGTVSGSYNLIGTGGSGGLTDGTDNNIVLSGTETAGLAPLGSYGGPTQTIALLPGSPAIGKGTAADFGGTTTPITTDQRGSTSMRRLPTSARTRARGSR